MEQRASVVFFRAVNVGGRQTFQPSKLARDLAHLDVVSIGSAGTFVIRNSIPEAKLREEILRRLQFRPDMIICPAREVLALTGADAFRAVPPGDGLQRFVTVLEQAPRSLSPLPLDQPAGDKWEVRLAAIVGRFVLSFRRKGAIYSNAVVENRLGISATTRNWNTFAAVWKALSP